MNVLSLFDGISGARIALDRAEWSVRKYFSSEIDKYAIKVSEKNYPDIVRLGDITKWEEWALPELDLIIAGFPCQSFSFAGKQLNFQDPRGKLFFEAAKILKHFKPKYFLFENVRMKQEFQDVISDILGVRPVPINSNLVSAQNRYRLYWLGKREEDGTYSQIPVEQPEDKGIFLKDIIEDIPIENPVKNPARYLPKEITSSFIDPYNKRNLPGEKSTTLRTNNSTGNMWIGGSKGENAKTLSQWKGGKLKTFFEKHRDNPVLSKNGMCHIGDADLKGNDSIKRVYSIEGKGPSLTTSQGGHREPKILVELEKHSSTNGLKCIGALQGTKKWLENGKVLQRNFSQGERVYSPEGKSPTLSAQSGGTAGPGNTLVLCGATRGRYRKDNTIEQQLEMRFDGKTNSLTTVQKDNAVVDAGKMLWRKLTPLECEKLQTISPGYTEGVSNSQRFKALGNGFTIDVIAHLLRSIPLGE